ncbi:hypothetical protein Tco_0079296 [Tanacetum coccineum]
MGVIGTRDAEIRRQRAEQFHYEGLLGLLGSERPSSSPRALIGHITLGFIHYWVVSKATLLGQIQALQDLEIRLMPDGSPMRAGFVPARSICRQRRNLLLLMQWVAAARHEADTDAAPMDSAMMSN